MNNFKHSKKWKEFSREHEYAHCYGLACVPSKFIWCSPDAQYLRMGLCLKMEPLKK